MKRLAHHLARLYPRRWRARYGSEFDALLEETNLTWRDVLDVITGALRMHTAGENYAMDNQTHMLRLIELKHRDIPHGYELETVIEYTRTDGSKTLDRRFFREVDFGDSYVTLNHWSRNAAPAQTIIVSGTKGEVAGDFRTDWTEMLVLQGDGTVSHTEQTVKTWMKCEAIREKLLERYRKLNASNQRIPPIVI